MVQDRSVKGGKKVILVFSADQKVKVAALGSTLATCTPLCIDKQHRILVADLGYKVVDLG